MSGISRSPRRFLGDDELEFILFLRCETKIPHKSEEFLFCSGDRNFPRLTTMIQEFEYAISLLSKYIDIQWSTQIEFGRVFSSVLKERPNVNLLHPVNIFFGL